MASLSLRHHVADFAQVDECRRDDPNGRWHFMVAQPPRMLIGERGFTQSACLSNALLIHVNMDALDPVMR